MKQFEEFGLSPQLLAAIKKLKINKPTQIQELAIPPIMEGKDVIGESATGSGKTLAFGCGIVNVVVPKRGIQALVLTPTRELAEQVKESLRDLSHEKGLRVAAIYGGVSMGPQVRYLASADVVVATPGRLLDHYEHKTIDLSKVKILVLDEADRMLDMGFINDVADIISFCPKKRQTMFFSATISKDILGLASDFMNDPVEISAVKHVDPSKLKQVYYDVQRNLKLSLLVHLLKQEDSKLVMVFCNTRRTTEFVANNLKANRINAIETHGGLSQNKRTKTLELFNEDRAGVLVCTDVAARGLHIENVSHIYNYDLPNDPKDYVHRIGRTARAGENGKVVNLVSEFDHPAFTNILHDYGNFVIDRLEMPYVNRAVFVRPEERRRPRGFSRGFRR